MPVSFSQPQVKRDWLILAPNNHLVNLTTLPPQHSYVNKLCFKVLRHAVQSCTDHHLKANEHLISSWLGLPRSLPNERSCIWNHLLADEFKNPLLDIWQALIINNESRQISVWNMQTSVVNAFEQWLNALLFLRWPRKLGINCAFMFIPL